MSICCVTSSTLSTSEGHSFSASRPLAANAARADSYPRRLGPGARQRRSVCWKGDGHPSPRVPVWRCWQPVHGASERACGRAVGRAGVFSSYLGSTIPTYTPHSGSGLVTFSIPFMQLCCPPLTGSSITPHPIPGPSPLRNSLCPLGFIHVQLDGAFPLLGSPRPILSFRPNLPRSSYPFGEQVIYPHISCEKWRNFLALGPKSQTQVKPTRIRRISTLSCEADLPTRLQPAS